MRCDADVYRIVKSWHCFYSFEMKHTLHRSIVSKNDQDTEDALTNIISMGLVDPRRT